jgi:ubiquinone/menaquinone biosynthesis C-methylase UbiE
MTKLNLGCGKRCFPDYMNVDVMDVCPVPNVPYTKADIRSLPFEDNSADEIFSCHVIEHIWPWEVDAHLKEWLRVLKPGGLLITECPNLIGASMILLEAVKKGDAEGFEMALNALYGDPSSRLRNIEQRHKWGYIPGTLAATLVKAGFVDARQEPAQFKAREPRDMRIVCRKP